MTRLRTPLLILGTLQALDVGTTYRALQLGAREGNPIALAVLAAGGFGALALVKLAVYLNAGRAAHRLSARCRARWALNATGALCIIYALVVGQNAAHVIHAGRHTPAACARALGVHWTPQDGATERLGAFTACTALPPRLSPEGGV